MIVVCCVLWVLVEYYVLLSRVLFVDCCALFDLVCLALRDVYGLWCVGCRVSSVCACLLCVGVCL